MAVFVLNKQKNLANKPDRLACIKAHAKASLQDAAAVNTTRLALFHARQATGLPVKTGTGGHTKFNRSRLNIPKTHALDAACVGTVATLLDWRRSMLSIKATGCGSYKRTHLNRFGFPRGYLMRQKRVKGFCTGDIVCTIVPSDKKAGTYTGRIAVHATGSFNIQTAESIVQSISHRYGMPLQHSDGYAYFPQPTIAWNKKEAARQVA
jgi:hypothetical protein